MSSINGFLFYGATLQKNTFLLTLLLISFSSSYEIKADESETNVLVSEPLKITAVVRKYFPPLYSTDENGKPQGYAIDLLSEITQIANIEVEYIVKENWVQAFDTLKRGEADIIPNLGIIKSRQEIYDFSSVIEILPISIFVRDETKNIQSIKDLKGKKVGVVNLNVGEKIANNLTDIETIVYAQPEHALIGLLSGNVDVIIYPKPIMQKYIRDSGLEERIFAIQRPIKEIKRAIAIHKGNEALANRLNSAIEIFLRSDRYNEVYTKWYGKEKSRWNIENVLILAFIAIFSIAILFTFWRFHSIKKINEKLTQSIENKNEVQNRLDEALSFLTKIASRVPGMLFQFEMNPNGDIRFPYVSEGIESTYKITAKELGKDVNRIFDLVHPDDIDHLNSSIQESAKTLAPWIEEYRICDPDGKVRWLLGNSNPEKEKDGSILWHGVVTDITSRKDAESALLESEARFRQLAENINEVFWLGSIQWDEVYYVSPAYEKNWGLNSEELYKQPMLWLDVIHPDDRQQVIADIPKQVSDIGEYVDFHRYRVIKPDGKTLWIKARAYPIRDNTGQIIRMAGIAEDITEQSEAEDALRRTQKMDALGKLTGGVAHDYNNMLGVVLGYADLIDEMKKDDPVLSKYIKEVIRAAERGRKLTKKLLSFSSNKSFIVKTVDINKLLLDDKDMLEKTLTARVELIFDLDEDIGFVKVDADDLGDAIVNMGINSMYAIEGNGKLTIKTEQEIIDSTTADRLNVNKGSFIKVTISDTGIGMDKSVLDQIFDPFFTTKGERGTGLGLSQVYGFVERSQGALSVSSEVGRGTEISLYFPQYLEDPKKKEVLTKDETIDLRGSETILVVDDEPSLVQLASDLLKKYGYNVICADSAKSALDILESNSIDVLLTDVIMPGMSGYELAELVREKYSDVKIQLMSGFTDNTPFTIEDEALRENTIQKPYKPAELLERIRELLNQEGE